ncbi:MAG: hypothetical protein V1692_02800 [bacterium]
MLKSFIKKIKNGQSGLTMIEIILALAILMTAIMSIIRIFPAGLQIAKIAEKNTVAAFLAQDKLEELAAMPYVDIPCCGVIETKGKGWWDDPDSPFYSYQRQTEIVYVNPNSGLADSATDLGIKKIKTTIYWQASPGTEEKSMAIYTLRSQR